jgi:hypothetical protein
MRVVLPFKLMPSSKDKELRSVVPRPFPQVGLGPSSTDGQDGLDENKNGEDFGGGGYGDWNEETGHQRFQRQLYLQQQTGAEEQAPAAEKEGNVDAAEASYVHKRKLFYGLF